MIARALAAFLVVTAGTAAASAETGALKRFKSWTVGCDNARACTAAAADSDRASALALALTRSGERNATPVIRLAFHHAVDSPREGTATLSASGRIVARIRFGVEARGAGDHLEITVEPTRAAILAALRREPALEVRFDQPLGEDQRTLYTIPLDGAAAALLWMDERQKRIGTVTALARPGSLPASAVPPAPSVPHAPKAVALPQGSGPVTLSKAALERIDALRGEGCEEGIREMDGGREPIVRRLGGGRLLVAVRCTWGGSWSSDSYFVVRDGPAPRVERARFPRPYEAPDESPTDRTPDFVLADVYDGAFAKGELSSGDGTNGGSFCGERAEWVWTGRRFEPREIRTLLPCGAANVSVPLHRTR